MQTCLILALVVRQTCDAFAAEDSVTFLPGYGAPPSKMFAGRLDVDASTRGVKLFYIFSSMLSSGHSHYSSSEEVPIIAWFQGGGGASPPWGTQTGPFALQNYQGGGPSTFGMLCEGIGPFTNPDNSTGDWVLQDNPHTWNRFAHLLFIDQPAGVGFSSFDAAKDGYANNGTILGHDVAFALAIFFERHQDLSRNPLYLFGESYAGHYVPHIASYILDHGEDLQLRALRRQLIGLGLGDVCPGEEHSISLAELMRGLGYLDHVQLLQARALATRCKSDLYRGDFAAAFKSCEGLEVFKGLFSGGIHDQDSRVYANYSSLVDLVNVDGATQEGHWNELANAWLDDAKTKEALHIAMISRSVSTNQRNATRGLWDDNDNVLSTLPLWPKLISNFKTLVYNGNFDVSCNFLGTETLLASLGAWFENSSTGIEYTRKFYSQERRWMTLKSQMSGYWRHVGSIGSGSLVHAIVQGAGHLAPRDQPARVQAMVHRFLINASLCDQDEGACRASDVALRALGNRCALLYNCSSRGTCTDEARCDCDDGWTGLDCSHGVHDALGVGNKTVTVAPDGWQYHLFHNKTRIRIYQVQFSTSVLPRLDIFGQNGLTLYQARHEQPWPLDPILVDLSSSFTQAWRLGSGVVEAVVLAGTVVGIKNHGSNYHAPDRMYTIHWYCEQDTSII